MIWNRWKQENALDLGSFFLYHPYNLIPELSYDSLAEPLRRFVKRYSGAFDILQGETGCPAQLEFAHAMHDIEWTEYAQAKWNLRRAMGDAARAIPSSLFTMIDLKYTFMPQSLILRPGSLRQCRWIVEPDVNHLGLAAQPHRARLVRVAADGHDVVERNIFDRVDGLRSLPADVDTSFRHDPDG